MLISMLPSGGIAAEICAAPTAGDGTGTGMLPPPSSIGVGNCTGPEDGMEGAEPAGAGLGLCMFVPGGITGPC